MVKRSETVSMVLACGGDLGKYYCGWGLCGEGGFGVLKFTVTVWSGLVDNTATAAASSIITSSTSIIISAAAIILTRPSLGTWLLKHSTTATSPLIHTYALPPNLCSIRIVFQIAFDV